MQVSHDTFKAHSEPAIAENSANPKNLVAGSKFFTDPLHYQFKIGTFYSTNGGQSWHDGGLLPGYENYSITSDISFAFSPNGSLVYACVLATDGTQSGIFVSRSRDGGKTWLNPSTVFLDTSGATFSDKPWIAVDWSHGPSRGTVYVAWNLDSNSDAIGALAMTGGAALLAAALAAESTRVATWVPAVLGALGLVVVLGLLADLLRPRG